MNILEKFGKDNKQFSNLNLKKFFLFYKKLNKTFTLTFNRFLSIKFDIFFFLPFFEIFNKF